MRPWMAMGGAVLAASVAVVQAAMAADNSNVVELVKATPRGPYVAATLVVVLVALLMAAGFLKRSNR